MSIRRDKGNDIVIDNLAVTELANGWYLGHVSGLFEPKVNKQAVNRPVKLNSLDTIEIGATKFQFIVRHDEAGH